MLGSTLWWWTRRWRQGWSGSRWRSNSEGSSRRSIRVITWHFCLPFVIVQLLFDKFWKLTLKCIKQFQISELQRGKMASALGNLMANYTDSEGEELAEGGSEGEGEGNPSLADRWTCCLNLMEVNCLNEIWSILFSFQIKPTGGSDQCNRNS